MTTKSAFIYCRISNDPQGRAEGVEAQEKWGRAYATAHWSDVPVRVFTDNDVSAAKEDAVRPGFDRMREAIVKGECAHLWSVEQSRLTRIESVWFTFAADLIRAGIDEVHTRRNGIIRLNDVVGGILAVIDANEVRKLTQRIADKHGVLAAEGRPNGGRYFGYRAGVDAEGRKTREIVPVEAAIIREAAERVLAGWSLSSITNDLQARGVRGTHGGALTVTSVRVFLTMPSIAGLRCHHGEIVGRATWQAVLTEDVWRMVCATLRTRTKVKRNGAGAATWHVSRKTGPARRRWLLTGGLAVCGTCGAHMYASQRGGGQNPSYGCVKALGGCMQTKIPALKLESHTAEELFRHLDAPAFLAALASDELDERRRELVMSLQAVDERRRDLAGMWSARTVTTEQFRIMNEGLDADRAHLEADLTALPSPASKTSAAQARASWPSMNLDERRAFVTEWIDTVIVHKPNGRGSPTYRDVAARAGVSVAAVNFSLSENPSQRRRASEGMRRRVLDAAAELGYVKVRGGPPFDPARVEIKWVHN